MLQGQTAFGEQQEGPRSTASVAVSCSSFNSAYAVPLSNVVMGKENMGPKENPPQDLLDISGIHMAVDASHEMN